MRSYEALIMEFLIGNTPKEKYDSLMAMQSEILELRAYKANVATLMDGIEQTSEIAEFRNIKPLILAYR